MQSEDEAARAVDGLRRLVQGLRASAHVAESDLGVSGAQLFVLGELAAEPGISIRRLSERTLTDPSSVSVVVARLEERGLLKRRRDTADARRSVLELTRKGEGTLARAPTPYQAQLIASLRQMPTAEVRRFANMLSRLVDAVGGAGGKAPLFFEEGANKKGKRSRVRKV